MKRQHKKKRKGSTSSSSHANSSLQSVLWDRFEGRPMATREEKGGGEKFERCATFVQRVVTIIAEDATASDRRIRKPNTSLPRRNKALEKGLTKQGSAAPQAASTGKKNGACGLKSEE